MNNQFISKVIKFDIKSCPEFVYENPLLDKTVARSVAKSFVRILGVSSRNSNVSSNLRFCVLENIRKLCQTETDGHNTLPDKYLPMLTQFYNEHVGEAENSSNESTDCRLEAFLIRNIKDMDIDSSFNSKLNPKVIQALLNLNSQGVYLDKLSTDIIKWNNKSDKHQNLIKDLWTNEDALEVLVGTKMIDDVSIKIKAELEKMLLDVTITILQSSEMDILDSFSSNDSLQNLIKKCSVSRDCFQMSIGILNFVFTATNFDMKLQEFIPHFVSKVKALVPPHKFIVSYPTDLSSLVILLDIDFNDLESPFKDQYVEKILEYLTKLHSNSEHDLILVLSHYPQWFDVYFNSFSY